MDFNASHRRKASKASPISRSCLNPASHLADMRRRCSRVVVAVPTVPAHARTRNRLCLRSQRMVLPSDDMRLRSLPHASRVPFVGAGRFLAGSDACDDGHPKSGRFSTFLCKKTLAHAIASVSCAFRGVGRARRMFSCPAWARRGVCGGCGRVSIRIATSRFRSHRFKLAILSRTARCLDPHALGQMGEFVGEILAAACEPVRGCAS